MRPADNAPPAVLLARWLLGEVRPESVPAICTDLLLAGYDTPSLRVLAGLTKAELERVRELLPQLFNELGLERPTEVAAAWRVAQQTAQELLADRLAPYDAARSIGDLGTRFAPLFPLLNHFIGLWSEWDDDARHRKEYEYDIRAAAQELVSTPPPAEPGMGSELDRMVMAAKQQAHPSPPPDMASAIAGIVESIPAGRIVSKGPASSNWTAVGSHNDRVVLLLHRALPFALVRPEYRHFVQAPISAAGIRAAEMSSADAAELSVRQESLEILAGHQLRPGIAKGWLSANEIRELSDSPG
jgi:hypothetical protein